MDDRNPIKYSDLVKPDGSITDLISQLKELSDTYAEAIAKIKGEASALADSLKKVSGATEQGREETRKAATEAEKLAAANKKLTEAQSENARKIADVREATKEANRITSLTAKLNRSAEGSYDRLSAQYSLNKIRLNAMTKAERESTEAGRKLETQTRELYEEMKRLQEATGKFQLNVGNYPQLTEAMAGYADKLQEVVGLNNSFGQSLILLGQNGGNAKAALTAIGDGAKALGKTLLGLLKNPVFLIIAGIASVGAAAKFWFDYNAGLVEATRLTQQFTGKTGQDLKNYRTELQAVADTFNVEFKEVLISTNALAKQFGISYEEALTIVKDGFVSGANAGDQFLEIVKEYPAYFKEAGISADQFVAIITQTEKMGIFSDKGIDAIKEANIRIREMTPATAAALEGIGISADEVQRQLREGATTTFEVMQQVSQKLNELPESSAAVGTAIADIFGGPGEDAGLAYLKTLKDISDNLDDVKDKSGKLGKLQDELFTATANLNTKINALFDQTGGNYEQMTTKAKIYAQEGLGAVVEAMINVVNWYNELYNKSLGFRYVVNAISAVFLYLIDVIGRAFTMLGDFFEFLGGLIESLFTLDWKKAAQTTEDFYTSIWDGFTGLRKDFINRANEATADLNKKLDPIVIPTVVADPGKKGKIKPGVDPNANGGGGGGGGNPVTGGGSSIEDAAKKQIEAQRRLEDAMLAEIESATERERKALEYRYTRRIEDLQRSLNTEKKLTVDERKAIEQEIINTQNEYNQAYMQLMQQQRVAMLEQEKKAIELRLQSVKEGSEEEYNLRLELLEKEQKIERLRNQMSGGKLSTDDINAKYDKLRAELADKQLQQELDLFDKEQKLKQSEFDLLKSTEEEKTVYRLKAERDRWNKILEINKKANKQLSENEVNTIVNTIKQIDNQIKDIEEDEGPKDIYELLGIDIPDEKKEAINSSISFAVDQLNKFLELRVESAQIAVDAAEKEVDAAQKVLDAELEARANGYANNVAYAQKELDLARKNQQKALKEREKAEKAQLALQAAQQAANLVTATSLIMAQLGFPWFIPAIALMWGTFAAAQIKAVQVTKQKSEQYGDGTVELLQGGSHQSGNDIDLGTKPDGTRRRAEGGEFFAVINKRSSRRYRKIIPDIINSLNNGSFASKYMSAYDGANGVNITMQSDSPDLRQLSDDVRAIKEQNDRQTYVDGDGNTVERYKNVKRIIKRR